MDISPKRQTYGKEACEKIVSLIYREVEINAIIWYPQYTYENG